MRSSRRPELNEERLWQLTVAVASAMAANPAGVVEDDAKTAVYFAGHVFSKYLEMIDPKPSQEEMAKLLKELEIK
jgi:hypothetical protein